MILAALLIAGALFVAYANGANDNFKGVATLYGSGTVGYRGALAWATLTTFAGSLCSVLLAKKLVRIFSAKGLVPESVAGTPEFLAAVALGARSHGILGDPPPLLDAGHFLSAGAVSFARGLNDAPKIVG